MADVALGLGETRCAAPQIVRIYEGQPDHRLVGDKEFTE